MKTNSLQAWILAARPKTLVGAITPVMVGTSLALYHEYCFWFPWKPTSFWSIDGRMLGFIGFRGANFWTPVFLCLLFAVVMQIDANFINDYFDFKSGKDGEGRLGPKRACTEGWLTPKAMKVGIALTTLIACLIGLLLVTWGHWWLIVVGVVCVACCFLYTTKFSSIGLGDLLVVIFFGIIPVSFTFYLAVGRVWIWEVFFVGVACGLFTDCLLIVNNYRDREQDKKNGKLTLVVLLGKKFGFFAYVWVGAFAIFIGMFAIVFFNHRAITTIPLFCLLPLHIMTADKMERLDGKELNVVLGETARNIFLFGLLIVIGMFL